MPKTKKTVRKNHEVEELKTPQKSKDRRFRSKTGLFILIGLLLVLSLFLFRNKGLIVAATIDNRPVWRWDVESRMVRRYSAQMTDEVVSEEIVSQAASKRGIKLAAGEIDAKISEIEKSLPSGMTLADALANQEMSVDDLKRQIGLQLMLEKMVAGQVAVSEQEIDDYLVQNKETIIATDSAARRTEARTSLFSTKQNDAVRKMFTDLKAGATIVKFL